MWSSKTQRFFFILTGGKATKFEHSGIIMNVRRKHVNATVAFAVVHHIYLNMVFTLARFTFVPFVYYERISVEGTFYI